jgi:hypothetical protein
VLAVCQLPHDPEVSLICMDESGKQLIGEVCAPIAMAPGHGQIIVEEMRREVAAWQTHRNNRGAPVNWRFTTDDARIKLSYIYTKL